MALTIEWFRLPADAIFILLGVVPVLIANIKAYRFVRRPSAEAGLEG
jgi:hypothetical protein